YAGGRTGAECVMRHSLPPRHRQRALGVALVAAGVAVLPAAAQAGLLPTTTTNLTTSLPTVSVPTASVPTVPTVTVPQTTVTVPSVTVPGTTTTTPSVTTTTPSSGDLQGTAQNLTGGGGGGGTTGVPLPTGGGGLPLLGGGGGGTGGTNNQPATGGNGSTGGGGSFGSGAGGPTSGGGGGGASAAAAPTLFGAAGGAGGSGGSEGPGFGGGLNGVGGGNGGPGTGAGGSPLLGIPVLPGGGTPGVTPLAAMLASQRVPAGTSRGFAGDVGHAISQFVGALPDWSRPVIGALLALVLVLLVRSMLMSAHARKLERQRESLADDVATLQSALLAQVPERLGSLDASVAYRPADGPASGGDFYDAFALTDGRVALVVGDASGHGRDAISRSASVRYTLRAYLDAGLEPNSALRVAGRALESDSLDGSFATAVVAVYDPRAGTLSYACAGHPPPILTGTQHTPITACAAPPIGWGVPTGMRLTTVAFPAGALACFFTDGLIEARRDGELFGRDQLARIVSELHPEADAESLLERLRKSVDESGDDMATLVLRATETPAPPAAQVEELEIEPPDLMTGSAARFLEACGVQAEGVERVLESAQAIAGEHGAATLHISMGDKLRVHVLTPRPAAVEPKPARPPAAVELPKIHSE
ncbi:MAG: PP2C family protein-serine/threonine phosphatase, partial [Thermoleophilaceae bacterium]